jgi:hypothetical protein
MNSLALFKKLRTYNICGSFFEPTIVVGLGLDSVCHPSDEARNILVGAIFPQVKLSITFI